MSVSRLAAVMRALLLGLLMVAGTVHGAPNCVIWPQWTGFRDKFLSDGGRVVDPADARKVTTSEGQAYALFFALVANDRAAFDTILRWTEQNLAAGDLTARLPAWLWGRRDDDSWGVLDSHAASDADLWIAYALYEAARLWRAPRYSALAGLLAQRVLREETAQLPALGLTLLPGAHGFTPEEGVWRLNPSYTPIQLLRRLAQEGDGHAWTQVMASAVEVVQRAAPRGFAPEWIEYVGDEGFRADQPSQAEGSFNAIRVYLWAGMLAPKDALRSVLLERLQAMTRHVASTGTPPLRVDTRDGSVAEAGPAGFSAALLPFLQASGRADLVAQQQQRMVAREPFGRDDNYYDQVLGLFGTGWLDGQYRFSPDGKLLPRWKCVPVR